MTKYILHGGFTRKDNEINRAFYREFTKDVPNNGTVLLVYFAARSADQLRDVDHRTFVSEAAEGKEIHFIIATKEHFLEELQKSDAVLLNGGSTTNFLEVLRTYPPLQPFFEGKTVAGSSAGAYVLSTLFVSHSEPRVREGLGILPLRVVCHVGSPDLPPNLDAVENLKHTRPELELVLLKDFEWKVFTK